MPATIRRLLFGCALALTTVAVPHAQWLNYPTPGVPRLPNGKVDLAAKPPRTAEGHPDLSGVWHVQTESLEEKRRLFGPQFGLVVVPGMEPETTSKYGRDLFLDFKPGEITMTAEGQARFDRNRRGDAASLTTACLPQ